MLDIQSLCIEYELETWLAPTKSICVLPPELQSNCAKYGLETWLVKTAAYLGWKCIRLNWRDSIINTDS